MPAQSLPPSHTPDESSPTAAAGYHPANTPYAGDDDEANSQHLPASSPVPPQGQQAPDSEGEDGSTSSQSSDDKGEYILVQLEDVSKEVQCPICLGIIRKTRTVKECLHRFCRECIDKAMRIGNNECPACRTHCASRRSLRDDPNFDALIAALYPDIDFDCLIEALYPEDKYKEEIQTSVAKTFRQRSEALGQRRPTPKATAAAFMRRSQYSYRSGRNSYYRRQGRAAAHNVSPVLSDYVEEEDVNGNDAIKVSSSEEISPDRIHKRMRMVVPRSSPARLDVGLENYDVEMNRENFRTSPLRAGNKELSWGKGGVRSQTRHGNSSGSNGRFLRAARLSRLTEYLHNLDENEDKFDVHLKLLPLNEQSMPLESPYLCCPPTLHIGHLRQFIAIQTSGQVEGIDLFVRKPLPHNQAERLPSEVSEEMQILGAEETLAGLLTSFTSSQGDLELLYRIIVRKDM